MTLVYKLFRRAEWAALERDGVTAGAPVDVTDGFIHFSAADQVRETAGRHFAGETELVLAACEAEALGPALRWEPSRGGALFPHLYRDLAIADVLWSRPLPPGPGGHVFPDDIP